MAKYLSRWRKNTHTYSYEDTCIKIKSILQSLNRWNPNQETLDNVHVYIDGSAPEFVRSLKVMVGEEDSPSYIKDQIDFARKHDLPISDYMTICPISFSVDAKNMLLHTKELLEHEARPLIGINSRFESLILSLRTAVSSDDGRLDKNLTISSDVLDGFRLALKHFRIKNKNRESNPILLNQL